MQALDNWLNRITMYKLLLYGLAALVASAIGLSLGGSLSFAPGNLLISSLVLLATCFMANLLFAKLFDATANTESSLITALILFCLFLPARTLSEIVGLVAIGLMAMASKYLLAWRQRHIFNPAAAAAVMVSWLGLANASWWVGNNVMWPLVLVLGLLVVRKIHRFGMVATYLLVAVSSAALASASQGAGLARLGVDFVANGPLLFLGFIMLTEPLTTPSTRPWRLVYGGFVGLLVGLQLQLGPIFISPELALILGNLLAYTAVIRQRLSLELVSKSEIGQDILEFSFKPNRPFGYQPGQYLEVTLPLHRTDSRGNRRSFTVASSPTEGLVKLGIKFYSPASSFKSALARLTPGQQLYANHLAGDFTLPANHKTKLLFIAGGIGITPFRSMAKYLIDTKQSRDAVLIYLVASPQQAAYQDLLQAAGAQGLKLINLLTIPDGEPAPAGWPGQVGQLTPERLKRLVPDYANRRVYISGPNAMVASYKRQLRAMGIKPTNIVTDYFAGY